MSSTATSTPKTSRLPEGEALFDRLRWRDRLSRSPLTPLIIAREPCGRPYCGALRVGESRAAYPIVDGLVWATPEGASRHADWLAGLGLSPLAELDSIQPGATVASFGFQWVWDANPRTEQDLQWRAAARFGLSPQDFDGKVVLDAGCGAGDQSRWFVSQGAAVVSVDLSAAIRVAYHKLRQCPQWVGVHGDITALPFEDESFDFVYCEGVIQHTRDSQIAVDELSRVLKRGGKIAATHYAIPTTWYSRLRWRFTVWQRRRLSQWDPYHLLAYTGLLAALASLPALGALLRLSNIVVHNPRMPDFKSTWSNTYDSYGSQTYQRYLRPADFRRMFDLAADYAALFETPREAVLCLTKK
ncbi:MAG: class I SAM-dependent methyltransferase [Chloroflexi bacterium]|nr:class I SAM-dependent methyltransferase [Chloroflexota bacterium]